MNVVLLVATLGRIEPLERLFASLAEQSYKNFHVLLADQNPSGVLKPLLERFADVFPITAIQLPAKGVSVARNAVLEQIHGDILAFPDDDSWYMPHALERVVEVFAEHSTLDGLLVRWGERPEKNGVSNVLVPVNRYNAFHEAGTLVQFFRMSAVANVRFDPQLGPGTGLPYGCGEDTDFLLQVLQHEKNVRRLNEVLIGHPAVNVADAGLSLKVRAYAKGRMHLLCKHHFPLWFKLANVLYPLLRLPDTTLRHGLGGFRYRWDMFLGRVSGLR